MTDERTPPAINVPAEVAAAARMPEDLDSAILGPYEFPNPRRRRTAGFVYLAAAVAAAAGAVTEASGLWVAVAIFTLVGVWHLVTAWDLRVRDRQALDRAGAAVGFTVGHGSAAVRFEGWRSRPVWNVLLYSADEPPSRRALVLIDGVSGELRADPYEEVLEAPS